MEIYTEEGKKLDETIFSVVEPYLDLWHHVYQDNYYNSVKTVENLIIRNTRVCKTIRANKETQNHWLTSLKSQEAMMLPVVGKVAFLYTSERLRGRFACLVQYIIAPLEVLPSNLEKR
jgi:hypothetical protein